MDSVQIIEVKSRKHLRRFINFEYSFYRKSPHWVPQLRHELKHTFDRKKNAFFEHGDMGLFLATSERGQVVGRIAAIYNGSHLEVHNDGAGFFGFFECQEKYEFAEALLNAAARWAKSKGLKALRGPVNPTINHKSALLTSGFDRTPNVLMPYNPPYYQGFLEKWGMEQVMLIWARWLHSHYVKHDRLIRGARMIRKRNPGLTLRPMDMSRFYDDVELMREIWNDGWENNWGYCPITENEFKDLAKSFKSIVDPRMCYIIELNGQAAAFSVCLPNINPGLKKARDGRLFPLGLAKILLHEKVAGFNELRMVLLGVKQKFQGRGFDVLPVIETIVQAPVYGYDCCETSWVLDSNKRMLNLLDSIGAVEIGRYGIFEKQL